MVRPNFSNWDIGFWVATALMAPLFAIVGSQISKIALAEKLALNKKSWAKIEAKRKAKQAAAKKKQEEETLSDKTANLTKLEDGQGDGTLDETEAELTKLEEEDSFFDDSMNISNPND